MIINLYDVTFMLVLIIPLLYGLYLMLVITKAFFSGIFKQFVHITSVLNHFVTRISLKTNKQVVNAKTASTTNIDSNQTAF